MQALITNIFLLTKNKKNYKEDKRIRVFRKIIIVIVYNNV